MVAGEEGARLFDGDEKAGGRSKEDERRNVLRERRAIPWMRRALQSPLRSLRLCAQRSPRRSFSLNFSKRLCAAGQHAAV
jgi:hypothetical protein